MSNMLPFLRIVPRSVSSLPMHRLAASIAVVLFVSSCSTSGTDTTVATTTTTTTFPATVADTVLPTAPEVTSLPQPLPPCLEGDRPFATSGLISALGGSSGDAAQISGIRAAAHQGCDRVVVDLLTVDGAPAGSLGPVTVEYDAIVGIVRINLPRMVTRTAVADSLFDGTLAGRAFVVRTVDGNLAVDVHVVAGTAVALRAFEVGAPSRIVVDLRPEAETPPVLGAVIGDGVVVTDPAPGPAVAPLLVSGYARTFEALVIGRLHDTVEGDPLLEEAAVATDWTEAWGEFTITFSDPPARPLELFVGSDSPRDGKPTGVWITVDLTIAEIPDSAEA